MCAAENKPRNNLFHFTLQGIVALLCVCFYIHSPRSGKALVVLAFMVAVMMLVDMRPVHKGFYIAIILMLVLIENRAIDKEHEDSARNQGEMMLRIEKAAKSQEQTFDWISGGEACAVFMVNPLTMQLEVSTKGPQPLRDVYINIFTNVKDNSGAVRTIAEGLIVGTVYPTLLHKLNYHLPVAGNSVGVFIRIYQLNGSFSESFNLEKQDGLWKVGSPELRRDKDGKRCG